jgi:hypothetical protein
LRVAGRGRHRTPADGTHAFGRGVGGARLLAGAPVHALVFFVLLLGFLLEVPLRHARGRLAGPLRGGHARLAPRPLRAGAHGRQRR